MLGEWWAISYGLISLFGSALVLRFVLMPGIALAAPAAALIYRGRYVAAIPFALAAQVYTCAVIAAWCMFIFYLFMSKATEGAVWPLLIWSYGVALGPWMYLAQKDAQAGTGEASAMSTFFAQVAYVIWALVAVASQAPLIEIAILFCGILTVGMIVQTVFSISLVRSQIGQSPY